ncbi:MAG: VOC family protein [Pseudomonadota bacterium]
MSIQLDHIFWMVPKEDVTHVLGAIAEFGLRESYRRNHPGQGTSNVCYCFENAFLEILWLESEEEARSPTIERTKLADRATGQANPFGIAWRGEAGLEMWDFRPPYLPGGISIPMAVASDDTALPLLFTFPGSKAPVDLPPERHGGMQVDAGLMRLEIASISAERGEGLEALAQSMEPEFQVKRGEPSVTLSLMGPKKTSKLTLPL